MQSEQLPTAVQTTQVEQIPVIWVEPRDPASRRLILWVPYFSGRKEQMVPYLRQLAGRGFFAASYDPWQHGERGTETGEQLSQRVFGNFRRFMWPILAHTSADALQVIDWAIAQLGVEAPVMMGGISMGGDVAVAAAGLDERIARVAAGCATPDWLRPGGNTPPGEPDAYARLLYHLFNPLTHLDRYARGPAITFECGAEDPHVPPDGALRFRAALGAAYGSKVQERVQVNLHPGVRHDFNEAMWANCLEWLAQSGKPQPPHPPAQTAG